MNKFMLSMTTLVLMLELAACSNPKAANNNNFKVAINKILTQKNFACVSLRETFPVDVVVGAESTNPNYNALEALKNAGLVSSTDTKKTIRDFFGPATVHTVHEYKLTSAGMEIVQDKKDAFETNLCYGNAVVDKIIKWTEPSTVFGLTMTSVTYTYKVTNTANWTKNSEINKAFPEIAHAVAGDAKDERNQDLVLTNIGWENAPR